MKTLLASLFIILLASTTYANENKAQLVEEYLVLSKTKETFDLTIDTYVQQMLTQNPNLSEQAVRAYFERVMGWQHLKAPTSHLVADTFTEKELRDINAFYKTESGVSLAQKTPGLTAALSNIIASNMEKLASEQGL